MSADFDNDDLTRLLALEHAFVARALISAGNYARLQGIKPSAAVSQFRASIESSLYDTSDMRDETRDLVRKHLRRMFDHVASMATQFDGDPPVAV
jgi:hypothetical protein